MYQYLITFYGQIIFHCMCMYIYIYIHTHMCVCIYMCVCVCVCIYTYPILFIHQLINVQGSFHFGATMINAAENKYIPRSGIATSYGNYVFNILKNCQIVFQSYCNILYSEQQIMRIPISPHPHQHLFFLFYCSHRSGCELVFHCSFDLHFPND